MPTRSQRPLVNKLLGLDCLVIGPTHYTNIDDALLAMTHDFSPERLSTELADQAEIEVTVSTLYRWRTEIEPVE